MNVIIVKNKLSVKLKLEIAFSLVAVYDREKRNLRNDLAAASWAQFWYRIQKTSIIRLPFKLISRGVLADHKRKPNYFSKRFAPRTPKGNVEHLIKDWHENWDVICSNGRQCCKRSLRVQNDFSILRSRHQKILPALPWKMMRWRLTFAEFQ